MPFQHVPQTGIEPMTRGFNPLYTAHVSEFENRCCAFVAALKNLVTSSISNTKIAIRSREQLEFYMRYKHLPTGREVTVYTYSDGTCRLAAYVVGDGENWKRKERQIVVTLDQPSLQSRARNFMWQWMLAHPLARCFTAGNLNPSRKGAWTQRRPIHRSRRRADIGAHRC